MPRIIPLNPSGDRSVRVSLGGRVLHFRCYFVHGQSDHWLLDIADAQGRPLFCGLNLAPGSDNLIKGGGACLEGCALLALTRPQTRNTQTRNGQTGPAAPPPECGLNAPGNDLFLIWLEPGEANPFQPADPFTALEENLTWY